MNYPECTGSRRLALWPAVFSLWLTAVCILALPRTSRAQTFTLLHSFSAISSTTTPPYANTDGAWPWAGLIQAKDGSLYGSTYFGGANGDGAIFKITTGGTVTNLYSFSAQDGAGPVGTLIQAKDGNFYGTARNGGAIGFGSVFKITPGGTFTTLYSFNPYNNTDGSNPEAGLIQASNGILYGTTPLGGAHASGTVFQITTGGDFTTLYTFSYVLRTGTTNSDGSSPVATLIQGRDGNLYGTTAAAGPNGGGTVFKLTTGGTLTTLYSFGYFDGEEPLGALVQATDGNLYGTTIDGGANGFGAVFKLTTGGTFTTLYSFTGAADGAYPWAGLIQARDGNLYGVTTGGYQSVNGDGTIFQITTGGSLTTLYTFPSGGANGQTPYGGLLQASDGNLYGTTYYGGANKDGTVFSWALPSPPILTSLSPTTANAAGPAFTLTLKGSSFASGSIVQWTQGAATTSLTTTYRSGTLLTASVPASLIATTGKATVTVATPGVGDSNGRSFTILLTTVKLLSAKLTQTASGAYMASVTLKNAGYLSAPNVTITNASLSTAATGTTLPLSLGSIANGKTGATSLSFPGSAGSSGTTVSLKVKGTFTGGAFSGSLNVKLP